MNLSSSSSRLHLVTICFCCDVFFATASKIQGNTAVWWKYSFAMALCAWQLSQFKLFRLEILLTIANRLSFAALTEVRTVPSGISIIFIHGETNYCTWSFAETLQYMKTFQNNCDDKLDFCYRQLKADNIFYLAKSIVYFLSLLTNEIC